MPATRSSSCIAKLQENSKQPRPDRFTTINLPRRQDEVIDLTSDMDIPKAKAEANLNKCSTENLSGQNTTAEINAGSESCEIFQQDELNQSMNLPFKKIRLHNFKEKLDKITKWHLIESKVMKTLEHHSLSQLIDSNIPRPKEGTVNSQRWFVASTAVALWLLDNLTFEKRQEIVRESKSLVYADEVWEAIRRNHRVTEVSADRKAFVKWATLKAADFDSLKRYTEAYYAAYKRMRNMGLAPGGYVAILQYLHGADHFDEGIAREVIGQIEVKNRSREDYGPDQLKDVIDWVKSTSGASQSKLMK